MAVKNSTILQRAWIEGSNDFQQRIPNPEIAGYESAVKELFSIQNNDLLNSFTGMLNGLNMTYVEGKRFENPLRDIVIKGEDPWGNSERHVAVKYLQAHCGIPNDETLLKLEMPEVVEWYLSNSTPRRYEFSWPRNQYMRAFARDGFGYDDLLATTFDQAYSSDAYDEMNIMTEQFGIADELAGGLYRAVLTNDPTTEAGAKELLQKIRMYASRMKFPTMLYNHVEVPVFESPNTLVLWVSAEAGTMSYLDVMALAYVFQLDKADVQYRIIEIPEFPIPNVYAALTSEDFIYGRDAQYGLEPAFYNPAQQAYKHYLFHQERIGINPAANCVLFTYGQGETNTVIPTVTLTPTGLAFTPNTGNIEPGGKLQTKLALTGTGATGKLAIEPDAAFYDVAITRTSGNDTVAVATNSATRVDNYGILHLQKTGVEAGDAVTVTAKSAYINPSGATSAFTATFTATVVAPTAQGAKECPVAVNPYIEYTDTTEEATASE